MLDGGTAASPSARNDASALASRWVVTGCGGERGDRGDEPGARLGDGRRRDEVGEQRKHVLSPPLDPADGDQLGAVPTERVRVPDVDPELVAPVGELFGVGEPPLPHREHHIEGGDEIAQTVAPLDDEVLAELPERAGGPAVAGEEEVHRAPGETHQTVDRTACRRGDGDQLVGEPEPPLRVLGPEQTVVRERQCFGELDRFRSSPRLLQLGQDPDRIAGHVRLLGGEPDLQPSRQRRRGIERRECLALECLDTRPFERRAVFVHPDPAEAQGRAAPARRRHPRRRRVSASRQKW